MSDLTYWQMRQAAESLTLAAIQYVEGDRENAAKNVAEGLRLGERALHKVERATQAQVVS